MISLSINEILSITNGVLLSGDKNKIIKGITTDSRKATGYDLFIPLIGERFDGHEYIQDAITSGIKAVLISDMKMSQLYKDIIVICVGDTLKALHQIATFQVNRFNIPIIGVTGSTGKTTTKDMIYSVLSQKYNTLKNMGNYNNHIGLPLTVFSLEENHEVAVLEMGMSNLGEIDLLADIVRPNIAVISNIGVSHIENLKTQENIMKAKMEITNYFSKECTLIVNGDDKFLKNVTDYDVEYKKILVGIEHENAIQAINIKENDMGSSFDIFYNGKYYNFSLKVPGKHNIYNALSAIAVGLELGMDLDLIQQGIYAYQGSNMRLNILHVNNIQIINDAYNASPDSMIAALSILGNMKSLRKIAVLGDMLEMGDYTIEGHYKVGLELSTKADILITVGVNSEYIAKGAIEGGLSTQKIYHCDNNNEAISILRNFLKGGDTVLVKGSRGMRMEEIVESIQERS